MVERGRPLGGERGHRYRHERNDICAGRAYHPRAVRGDPIPLCAAGRRGRVGRRGYQYPVLRRRTRCLGVRDPRHAVGVRCGCHQGQRHKPEPAGQRHPRRSGDHADTVYPDRHITQQNKKGSAMLPFLLPQALL